jgi:hypothetical protein
MAELNNQLKKVALYEAEDKIVKKYMTTTLMCARNFSTILIVFIVLLFQNIYAQSIAINSLNLVIGQKTEFIAQKEARIEVIKKMVPRALSPINQYQTNKLLYEEYQKFRIDSAVIYATRNINIAHQLNRGDLLVESKLQLTNLYSSSDRYIEAKDLLNSISRATLSGQNLIDFYQSQIQLYEHYNSGTHTMANRNRIKSYRDSLLEILPHTSMAYDINLSEQYVNSDRFQAADDLLKLMLLNKRKSFADYAMATYLLGSSYQLQNKPDSAIRYYALSAIADVQNAIKDNASMQALALVCYQTGDINHAYIFTQSAIQDAIFSNVKFRTAYMSELYAIINSAYQKKEEKGKSELKFYLALISLLSGFLVTAVIYLYKQMKKISRIKEELDETGKQLSALNKEISEKNVHLNDINGELSEANKVKEIYIAQFFDLCSTYINKLEDYRKLLNKKAQDKQLDDLFRMLRSTQMIHNEADELYKIFDTIFLSLYPNFVCEFNSLLIPEEKIIVKTSEFLNTELRIYALIRLGITDSVKIASFLRYSLSTIYNYRTAARNKAAVSRDTFESQVMKIGSIGFQS